MEHAGGIRRGVASICDRSFDLISILGKVDFGTNSYIGPKMIFFKNRFLKIDFGQTSTQNDRNDHRMISGFRCKHRLDSVFTDEISIVEANLDFHFSL